MADPQRATEDARALPGPIAYLTGQYPLVSHTFIQREIAALRNLGADILTVSVRRPGPEQLTGPEEQAAHSETAYLLEKARNPFATIMAVISAFAASPQRFFQTVALAARTARPGIKGNVWQAFYFVEACILSRYLKQQDARHLHNHFADSSANVAMLMSKLSAIPFSFTLHGPAELFEPQSWHIREKVRQSTFTVCISQFARSQAMLFSDPDDWSKLVIVHCGVQPARYHLKKTDHAPSGLRLLFVGRLAAIKGLRVLLEAFARLREMRPDISLVIIGDGPDRAYIEKASARIGGIIVRGFQSQDAVAEAFQSADALVLPSFAEGVPVVLMEAMASGLPVIATAVGGVSELVEDSVSGIIVAPGDVDALHSALSRLLDNPQLRHDMGIAGRARVIRDFDVDMEARRLLTSFSHVNDESAQLPLCRART